MIRFAQRMRRGEEGYSLPELLVSIFVGTMVLGGLFTLVNFTMHSNAQTTNRVAVDQVARPAMQRIVDGLNSSCIYPGLAPVQAGSTGSQINFIAATGVAANPTPVMHRMYLDSSSRLVDSIYPYASGTAPNWAFSSSASQNFVMLERAAALSSSVPIFRYYRYVNGAISSSPLPATGTGLSAENAKVVVQVTVTFRASLSAAAVKLDSGGTNGNASTYTESVLLRFSPSNEDTNKAGLPCT